MRPTKLKRSQRQEQRTASSHQGRVQPGSGAFWSRKGDVKTKTTLVENKRTDAKGITLKATDLNKIWTEAVSEGLVPVLQFDVGGRAWVAIPEADYLELQMRSSL